MKDNNEFIRHRLNDGTDTPASVILKNIGDETIVYGIAGIMVPLGDGNALLILESDRQISETGGEVYILIRKDSRYYKRVEDGRLLHYYGKRLFARGVVVDFKYTRPDDTIHTVTLLDITHELRALE